MLSYKFINIANKIHNNKWYRNFLELCKGEHLPGNTKPKDVKQYLIYK